MKALEKLKKILEKYSLESLNKDMTLAYNNALFELEEILEEDMADKKYTEEDIIKAYIESAKAWSDLVLNDNDVKEDAKKYYNSLNKQD